MGGSAKAPKASDEQVQNDRLSAELMKEQLKQAKKPPVIPDIKVPPPAPPPPPPPSTSSADAVDAAREARIQASRRLNSAKGTLFAGETGGYKGSGLGGAKTLLG